MWIDEVTLGPATFRVPCPQEMLTRGLADQLIVLAQRIAHAEADSYLLFA
jgi:hypothetical protein